MSKNAYRTPTGLKDIKCSSCKTETMKVDSESVSGICYRCVSRGTNSDSVMVTDLGQEEYKLFIKKMFTIWKTQEQPN